LPRHNWDGTGVLRAKHDAEQVSHDTAHFLVARPEERDLLEFGLGSSTWAAYGAPVTTDLTYSERQETEACASLLGVMICAQYDREYALRVWENHSWDDCTLTDNKQIFRILIDAGHLVWRGGRLRPAVLCE
jgi:hypothetical protein